MPQMSPLSWIAWAAVILAQPAIAIQMITAGAWRRWPSVFTFLAFNSLVSFALFAVMRFMPDSDYRAAVYFYLFWLAAAVSEALEVWIIIQICLQIAGFSASARTYIVRGVIAGAAAALTACIWLVSLSPMSPYGRVTLLVMDLNRAISLAWLLVFLSIALSLEFLGVQWEFQTLGLGAGLAINISGQLSVSWVYSLFPKHTLSDLREIAYLASLGLWAFALRVKFQPAHCSPSVEAFQRYVRAHRAIIERIKERP